MAKISIITPVYCEISQKVDWLDEMIQSVQAQSFTDWEMILIDDRSPLPIDFVKMKHDSDGRLRWFDNAENSGPSKTRNTAVALAQSNCILPLDSDDMLAENDTLEKMYDEWSLDETKIIYGNLQQYKAVDGSNTFRRLPPKELGQYTFELAMNLLGIMPVTAMHSKNCFLAAGGWSNELDEGLEDVEYWIAAGERGYCGIKINATTLVYRQQETSRAYQLRFVKRNMESMQRKIKDMHPDIYQGRFPAMACGCAENAAAAAITNPLLLGKSSNDQRIVELQGFNENELEWVLYNGGKKARFDILAQGPANLPSSYTIYGTGQIFQIHKKHRNIFSARQRLGFQMNQPDPRQRQEDEVTVTSPSIETVELADSRSPIMSTIVRMDATAAQTITADIQPLPEGFLKESETEERPERPVGIDTTTRFKLSDLELSESVTNALQSDQARLWTVEKISRADPEILTAYKGIGTIKARAIIAKAKTLIKSV